MMKNRITGLFSLLVAATCWYLILPVQNVLAASGELNLDIADDPQIVPMPSMIGLFLRLIVSLVIIVGLAYLTVKVLRKNIRVLSRGTAINVLDQYAFSLNKAVYITQIAGRVYVLGVTDHNISLITEITDRNVIDELEARAREAETEPIIPSSILDRIFPGLPGRPRSGHKKPFSEHIQHQIKKLQSIVENSGGSSREDDRNE